MKFSVLPLVALLLMLAAFLPSLGNPKTYLIETDGRSNGPGIAAAFEDPMSIKNPS
jgi:hypothetical protein